MDASPRYCTPLKKKPDAPKRKKKPAETQSQGQIQKWPELPPPKIPPPTPLPGCARHFGRARLAGVHAAPVACTYMWVLESPPRGCVDAWMRVRWPVPQSTARYMRRSSGLGLHVQRGAPLGKSPPQLPVVRLRAPRREACSLQVLHRVTLFPQPRRCTSKVPPLTFFSFFSLDKPPRLESRPCRSVDARFPGPGHELFLPPPARCIIACCPLQPRPVEARIFLNIVLFFGGCFFRFAASIEPR